MRGEPHRARPYCYSAVGNSEDEVRQQLLKEQPNAVEIEIYNLDVPQQDVTAAAAPSPWVGANVLVRRYDENPIAADARYRYKTGVIVGHINRIGREITGKPYIVLGTMPSGGVQCVFSTDEEVMKLKKGQVVAVLGEVKGLIMFNVLVNNCQLTDMPTPKTEPKVRKATPVARNGN